MKMGGLAEGRVPTNAPLSESLQAELTLSGKLT